MTVSYIIDQVAEEVLYDYKLLIEIAEELDDERGDEIKNVCADIVSQLEKLKPLDY